jgi:hypothetical protein
MYNGLRQKKSEGNNLVYAVYNVKNQREISIIENSFQFP